MVQMPGPLERNQRLSTVLRIGSVNSGAAKPSRMRNGKRMSETRYWTSSQGIKERNRKKSRLRRIGSRTRSTRWLAEVRLGNSTKISWIRVLERFIEG